MSEKIVGFDDMVREIAKLKEDVAKLIEVVYELSKAEIEMSGEMVVGYTAKQTIKHLRYGDAQHVPIGER